MDRFDATNQFYIGTMGFSYKDWSGVFYPQETATLDYLHYYSRIFNAVEIDSTFYGAPRREVVERWKNSVPTSFRFCLKVPRRVTHDLSLVDAEGIMEEFIRAVLPLEEMLGCVLLQFPPSFKQEKAERLEAFLRQLPTQSLRFAVEFRDQTWYTAAQETANLLAQHKVCWAATHYPELPIEIHLTSHILYLRWIGRHGSYREHHHERIDRLADLNLWWQAIKPQVPKVEHVFGFFNNDYAGFAPATANRFKKIAGLPVVDFEQPRQGRLF